MDLQPGAQGLEPRPTRPEFKAAVFNGALICLGQTVWVAYVICTSTAVRPSPPTLLSSALAALPALLALAPISLLVGWRTYVHARAFRLKQGSPWRGPFESAAIAGGIALLIMVRATALTWMSQPFYLVIAYILFYVGATAMAGFVLGIILAATLLVIYLQRNGHSPAV